MRIKLPFIKTKKLLPFGKEFPITSKFGYRIIKGKRVFHNGTDYGTPYGTPLYAMKKGKVSFGTDQFGGLFITLRVNKKISWRSVHLSQVVKVGKVKKGDLIGYTGNSGYVLPKPTPQNPHAGSHTHVERYENGKATNPAPYIRQANLNLTIFRRLLKQK